MGMWDFVKNAGKSLFGGAAEAATPDADTLKKEVKDLGLNDSGLTIETVGDTVKISGAGATPEAKEKVILAVGNVAGVAKVEADDDDAAPAPVFYTVKKGDTLSAISKATLGNANRYNEIFEANRPMLTHPDKIYPGQMLRIPQA